jgi:hypothetical protein
MTHRPTPQQPLDDGWLSRAACRDSDARLFTDPQGPDDVRKAMATCNTCSVRAACLAAALRHSIEADVGIWGGTTEQTRRQIRAGRLITEQALNPDGKRCAEPEKGRVNGSLRGKQTGSKVAQARPVTRLPAPETTVALDKHGDYVSADQRVLIFRIHGERPWALAIDDRFITTTPTVTEARRIAWTTLHDDDRQASRSEPAREARQIVAPVEPRRR